MPLQLVVSFGLSVDLRVGVVVMLGGGMTGAMGITSSVFCLEGPLELPPIATDEMLMPRRRESAVSNFDVPATPI
jgi:hypothetical protein